MKLSLSDAEALVTEALPAAGANPTMAAAAARALVLAESQGLGSHGLSRVAPYATPLRPVAEAGLGGLGFANSPAAMPAAGGRHLIFGTTPVAAVFPRRAAPPTRC